MAGTIDLPAAVATFAHGYAWQRSRTHPYLAQRLDGVWRLYDADRASGDYRREEYIPLDHEPVAVDALARATARGRYSICAIQAGQTSYSPLRDAYRALGYRLGTTEPFFVHDLVEMPDVTPPEDVVLSRVEDADLAHRLTLAQGLSARRAPAYLADDSPERMYVALRGHQPVSWVASTLVEGGCTWCGPVYTLAAHRRQGLARALLALMLRDDRQRGAQASVLLASHTGAMLYPQVGYRQVGTLLGLTPARGL